MDWTSKGLIELLTYLLPGFLAAWVIHALTPIRKADAFERVVHALILTYLVHAVTLGAKSPVVCAAAALLIGLVCARWANNDTLHQLLRGQGVTPPAWIPCRWADAIRGWCSRPCLDWAHKLLKFTCRTSYPSQWFSSFQRRLDWWLVLHFKDGRRLYGWATEWPDHPNEGHFVMERNRWLMADGTSVPLYGTAQFVIPVDAITMVEFIEDPQNAGATPDEIETASRALVSLNTNKGEQSDGSPSTATTTTETGRGAEGIHWQAEHTSPTAAATPASTSATAPGEPEQVTVPRDPGKSNNGAKR